MLVLAVVVAGLTVTPSALAAQPATVTATGTRLVRVLPTNRKSNASIRAAVNAAQKAGVGGALVAAHDTAVRYAKALGLTLGGVLSVSDAQGNGFYGPFGGSPFEGPFGVNRYCGIERRPVFKTVDKKRKLAGFKKRYACIVPRYQATTLTVTYAAT